MGIASSTFDFNELFLESKKMDNKIIRKKLSENFKNYGNRPVFFITKKNKNEFIIHRCDGNISIINKETIDKFICNNMLEYKLLSDNITKNKNNYLNRVVEGYEYIKL